MTNSTDHPVYQVDDETRDYLISLVENSVAVSKMQMDPTSAQDIQELCDEICNRFDLVVEQTHYDIIELEIGDILWQKLEPEQPQPRLRKVVDNTQNNDEPRTD